MYTQSRKNNFMFSSKIKSQNFSRTKKSQSALEYMMTYGWAILIIVIVAVILYSMGIFNPSSSLTTTITGFSELGVTQAACINTVNNQILAIYVSNTVGYPVNVTDINVSGNNGVNTVQNVNSLLRAGQSGVFYVNGACNKSTSSYSGSVAIKYTEPSQILPGPYFSKGSIGSVSRNSNPNLVGKFNGVNSIIKVSSSVNSPCTITVVGWSYDMGMPSSGPMGGVIGLYSDGQSNSGWVDLEYNDNSLRFEIRNETISNSFLASGAYLNTWVFSVAVDNKGIPIGYVDTQQYTDGSVNIGCVNSLGAPFFGNWDRGFNGSIANLQIYTTALSQGEIQKLYSEGVGGAPISNAGLIGWWPLDGNPNDYSGNNNNGVATDIQWVSP